MKEKYSPYCEFIHMRDKQHNSSWIWNELEQGLEILRNIINGMLDVTLKS